MRFFTARTLPLIAAMIMLPFATPVPTWAKSSALQIVQPTVKTKRYEGRCVSVTDGDTIRVKTKREELKVRLLAIDAPEKAQKPWGMRSSDFLKSLVLNKDVVVQTDKLAKDHYGRTLGHIFVGDIHVNLELVKQGHAMVYIIKPNKAYEAELRAGEAEAKAAGRGVWNPAEPMSQRPDQYRKAKRNRS